MFLVSSSTYVLYVRMWTVVMVVVFKQFKKRGETCLRIEYVSVINNVNVTLNNKLSLAHCGFRAFLFPAFLLLRRQHHALMSLEVLATIFIKNVLRLSTSNFMMCVTFYDSLFS